MTGPSVIEIDRSALIHNLNFIQNYLGKDVKISSVVKANAYGHGIEQFVPVAEEAGINHFSVFSADEAQRVFKVKSPQSSVMIMGWVSDTGLEWVIKNEIEFYIFELSKLEKACRVAKETAKKALIHIEVETGMNRTGLDQKQLQKVVDFIKS